MVLALAVLLAVRGMWLWLVTPAMALFYLGIIGSKLHPLQSARDLASGPLEGPAAGLEHSALPSDLVNVLVGHACTRVGILLGCGVGVVLWAGLGWRWYGAALLAIVAIGLIGGTLKYVFQSPSSAA
jgi:hypothetical protein